MTDKDRVKSFAWNKDISLGEIHVLIKYWAFNNKLHTDSNG
jgi:hypothetical protein